MILLRQSGVGYALKIGMWWFMISMANVVKAQTKVPFESLSIDRPDVSNLPTTIRPGHYQIELGAEFARNDFVEAYSLPNVMFRTGLGKKVELRIGMDHQRVDSSEYLFNKSTFVSTISFKYRFIEENGPIPAVAIQPDINCEFVDGEPRHTEVYYALVLLFNNSLHEKIFINYNAGITVREQIAEYLVSASLSFMHTHRLGYFLEAYYRSEHIDLREISLDAGITYLVKPRLQFDIYTGREYAPNSNRFYFGLGVGLRMDKGDFKPKSFQEVKVRH